MGLSKKIILLGQFGVGKSSLIRRFVENTFSDDYIVTIGVHILKKTVEIDENTTVNMIVWDVEGTDDLSQSRSSYLLGTSYFVYVFDLTRPTTYQNIKRELNYIRSKYPNIPVKVVGNKSDLIDIKETKSRLKEENIEYDYFSSAKTGANVEKMFQKIAKELI